MLNVNVRGGMLLCTECGQKCKEREAENKGVKTEGIECCRAECRKSHFDFKWSQKQRDNLRTGHTKSICPDCAEKRYTTRDTDTYTCDEKGCKFKGGREKFTKESMSQYKKMQGKGKIICLACGRGSKARRT